MDTRTRTGLLAFALALAVFLLVGGAVLVGALLARVDPEPRPALTPARTVTDPAPRPVDPGPDPAAPARPGERVEAGALARVAVLLHRAGLTVRPTRTPSGWALRVSGGRPGERAAVVWTGRSGQDLGREHFGVEGTHWLVNVIGAVCWDARGRMRTEPLTAAGFAEDLLGGLRKDPFHKP